MAQENVIKFIEKIQEDLTVKAKAEQIINQHDGNEEDIQSLLDLAAKYQLPFTAEEFLQEMKKHSQHELDENDLELVVGGSKNSPDVLAATGVKEFFKIAVRAIVHGLGHCFTAGSLVATPTGSTPIEKIAEGDEVLTLNAAGEIITGKVTKVHPPAQQEIIHVQFTDGKEWHTTATQWYYCGNDKYNIAINTQGKPAITLDGTATVAKATFTGKTATVYDFEVEGINIMFINGVAAEGYSLH